MKRKIAPVVFMLIVSAILLWMNVSANSHFKVETASAKKSAASDSTINWKGMDHAARLAYMKQVVMPKMKDEFYAFDSVRFAKVNCKTCHGSGAMNGSFKMPNPEIFKLPSSPEGWKKVMDTKGDMLKFMKEKVKPEMSSLLGMPPYDMKTKTGFGCGNCHTDQEK